MSKKRMKEEGEEDAINIDWESIEITNCKEQYCN